VTPPETRKMLFSDTSPQERSRMSFQPGAGICPDDWPSGRGSVAERMPVHGRWFACWVSAPPGRLSVYRGDPRCSLRLPFTGRTVNGRGVTQLRRLVGRRARSVSPKPQRCQSAEFACDFALPDGGYRQPAAGKNHVGTPSCMNLADTSDAHVNHLRRGLRCA